VDYYRAALKEVLEDLDAAQVPQDLREVAFTLGMKALLGGSSSPLLQTTSQPPLPQLNVPARGTAPTADSPGALLASRLGVTYEDVSEVFSFSEKGPELIVGSSKIPAQAAAAAKELAILIAAARQGTALEEWTAFSDIRDALAQYGRLDSNNFATTMKELDAVFSFRSPSPRKREVKLNRPGWERATALVTRLVEG
jgi:hypothetical protein